LTEEPYIDYNPEIDVLCITAGTAFQHDADGEVVYIEGRYASRWPRTNAITYALERVLYYFTADEWERVKANDPEQLSKISRAIKETYEQAEDDLLPPCFTSTSERVDGTRVLCKRERVPNTARYGASGTGRGMIRASKVLPSVGILDTYDNDSFQSIGPFKFMIDGTVASKDTHELCALSTGSVNRLSAYLAGMLPFISNDLAELAKSKEYGRNKHLSAVRKSPIQKKLQSLVYTGVKHWNSYLDPTHIDPERVEGSDSKYSVKVSITGLPELDPIEIEVAADYSRITDGDTKATAEGQSVR